MKEKENNIVAIIMSIRNEESIIDFNILYHLDLGFDYIFIVNHCSTDNTRKILEAYKNNFRVVVVEEQDPVFDHAKITNKLIHYANDHYKIDWFVFLDADEFFSIKDKNIHDFLDRLNEKEIPYATIGWINALFNHTLSDYTCSPAHSIDTTKYYLPWPERDWQEYGHFRKTIVRNHQNIEVVVGGHYVKTENNPEFFGEYHWNPFIIPQSEARLLHFEFRDKAEMVYKKWEKLASFENDSTSSVNAPHLERIRTIRKYVDDFKDNIDEITKRWFSEHRSFWGTIIPKERIVYDTTIAKWYGKYFRSKIESGNINSVCLVRSGHLGDVIMTEPIARFLSKYVKNIYLATGIDKIDSILGTYDGIYKYNQINSGEIKCDLVIKLIYEFSNNKKTYTQGYMESIGFEGVDIDEMPVLKDDWRNVVDGNYFLIAPNTSHWEEKKRNWGYNKYLELSKLLTAEYNTKCIILDEKYSFEDMISLIKHCDLFIGNDSGPAVIAQSFKKKSFVIFGATRPDYIKVSEYIFQIYDKNRHKLCNHNSREEEINCCEEFCMERLTVKKVFNQIKQNYE